MNRFIHDGLEYELEANGAAWDLLHCDADGQRALVGTGLFAGQAAEAAQQHARTLLLMARPVGVRIVPPDLARPGRAGELCLIGPDLSRPLFTHWSGDSRSFPRRQEPGVSLSEGQHEHQE